MSTDPPTSVILHASTVALGDGGLLILGPSGAGKSSLALDLIALGAELVADDRTHVRTSNGELVATAPESIAGRIEARHVGLLTIPFRTNVPLALAIDLGQPEPERLPPRRTTEILGVPLTMLYRPPGRLPASALLQCLLHRRTDP
ncbi:Hpr(Ser) kinase/phosphatase [Aliiruegeria haliotis]|uniref:Hpr(Ser) kinase/phosphatase n=1 Tax=Aliiruegeria haliotis TaxID=1280846 RepID=A0A2T0RFC8_9RHOB|nr:serine kinase [Aliiruegeria haliotis]PRY19865.1 Hpr(Ser) kinase/phosphatase [Aliiruegeria haliotis]